MNDPRDQYWILPNCPRCGCSMNIDHLDWEALKGTIKCSSYGCPCLLELTLTTEQPEEQDDPPETDTVGD